MTAEDLSRNTPFFDNSKRIDYVLVCGKHEDENKAIKQKRETFLQNLRIQGLEIRCHVEKKNSDLEKLIQTYYLFCQIRIHWITGCHLYLYTHPTSSFAMRPKKQD
jgi:hypothetical protein